jgi:hypothetical protein
MKKACLFLTALVLGGVLAASAQPPQPQNPPDQPALSPDDADISITGSVTIRELRVEGNPEVKVEFVGTPERITDSGDERTNLPKPVTPGVYRDVTIRFRVLTALDVDRIVARLLGQAPPGGEETVTPPLRRPDQGGSR